MNRAAAKESRAEPPPGYSIHPLKPPNRYTMANQRTYRIKGRGEQYLRVNKETNSGVSVTITTIESGFREEHSEFMPRNLFETCLRTDYLIPSSST